MRNDKWDYPSGYHAGIEAAAKAIEQAWHNPECERLAKIIRRLAEPAPAVTSEEDERKALAAQSRIGWKDIVNDPRGIL